MATVTFTGTTSGDMTVATNYAGGVAPASGDTVIFNTGSRSVTVGPSAAFDLAEIICTSGWSGSFGTPGSPITFQGVTGTFTWAGSGDGCYISVASGKTIANFVAQRGFGAISGAGTVTSFYNETADFNLTVSTLSAYYGMTPNSRITIGTSANAVANESFSYGTVTVTDRTVTTARIIGKNGRMYVNGTTAQATTLHVQEGAIYNSLSSGTITTANVSGMNSLITPNNSQYAESTITNLNLFSGGKYVQFANGSKFLITNLKSFGSQSMAYPVGPLES